MAEDTFGLNIPIGADPSGLGRGVDEAGRILNTFEGRVRALGSLGDVFTKLGQKLTLGITVPLTALATASVKAYGDIQALQLGLQSITGSAAVANREFQKLKDVAKLPGIGLQEAVKGSINLQAIGYSAGTARNILLQFGNAIASVGKGRVELDRAIYGVTQLANTPFPLGEDLNIIADALPQVRTLLQDAFGKTRSDDLAKMGVTSKQIMDVILKGLGELPRVTGGIKNSFENLKDSLQQNLARIGKIIDTNLDISGTINKLTDFIDRLITRFENLSPGMQKVVLITAALAAATGPVLVGLGGILAIIPSMVSGFATLKAGVAAFNATLLANPYTAIAVALTAVAAAVAVYYASLETAKDRQDRLNSSLARASIEARNEQTELATLYQKTQDQNIAYEERRKAVDQLQKQYPGYFGNIKDEIILAGKAGDTYKQLTVDILKASRARAAQGELDRRNADRLENELDLREKITKAYAVLAKNTPEAVIQFNQENPFDGIDARNGIRAGVKKYIKTALDELAAGFRAANKEDFSLTKIISEGQDAINKLDINGPDKLIEGLAKTKKERERQIAEIIPPGSIADFQKRADLLKKSIEYSVDGLVKVRGLDKFGKDVDKKGNPYYTGLVLPIEQAYEELEKLQVAGGQIDLQPIKMNTRGFLDSLGNEFNTYGELLSAQNITIQNNLLKLASNIDTGSNEVLLKTLKLKAATEELNTTLAETIQKGVGDSITSAFENIGTAIGQGENVIQALGSSLIQAFGGILTQLGKQMVTYGTSLLALKIAMKSLNPYVAIAAGAALIAIGAAVTGAVRNQSNAIGGGGGSMSTSTGASNPNYSASYTASGGGNGGQVVFRIEGRDLVGVLNREAAAGNRLNAN